MATVRARSAKPFEIHHDEMVDELMEEDHRMEDSRAETEATEDHEDQEDAYSDMSEESDGVVDATVQEDMDKFQDTFRGLKDRFRLINRIGEGNTSYNALATYNNAL